METINTFCIRRAYLVPSKEPDGPWIDYAVKLLQDQVYRSPIRKHWFCDYKYRQELFWQSLDGQYCFYGFNSWYDVQLAVRQLFKQSTVCQLDVSRLYVQMRLSWTASQGALDLSRI